MLAQPAGHHGQALGRIDDFLGRDPVRNFHITSTWRHEHASIVGLAEHGGAVVGVAVAGKGDTRQAPLVRLEAIGPIALCRLLSTMRTPPRRLMLHRPWMAEALESAIGPLRVRSGVELYADVPGALPALPPDGRVRPLCREEVDALTAESRDWVLTVLAGHLARGWQAFGLFEDGMLVAHACCGFPTAEMEEICHVYTAPARRGHGLAGAVVSAAAAAIEARGRRTLYFCRTANAASRRVAERSGLRHVLSMQEVAAGA